MATSLEYGAHGTMQSSDTSPTEPENPPKLYGLKTAFTLAVLFMFGWGYYWLVQDTLLHSALDSVLRDLPAGARKFLGAIASFAGLILPPAGAFYVLLKAGLWLDVRRHFPANAAAAYRQGSKNAEAQMRAVLETQLAKMKAEGATAEDIAEVRRMTEDSMAKSLADAAQRAKLYEENPALAEHDYRMTVESIRAKQRLKEF